LTNLAFAFDYDYSASRTGIEIPIRMWLRPEHPVLLSAKVDTGAEYCVFQRAYAEQLGIEVEKGESKPMHTATDRFDTFGHRLNLACFDWVVESTVYFASDERFPRNVVGLNGWLDRFRFGLVHQDSRLYLSHYED
jgi:hypothetical protein